MLVQPGDVLVRDGRIIAWDRDETDPCQVGTDGCAIDHDRDHEDSCETW